MSLMLALTTCHPPIMFIVAVAKCIDSLYRFSMAPWPKVYVMGYLINKH